MSNHHSTRAPSRSKSDDEQPGGEAVTPRPKPALTTGLTTAPAKHGKPAKPYSEYPLTPHPSGRWCKRIWGRLGNPTLTAAVMQIDAARMLTDNRKKRASALADRDRFS